MSRLQRSFDWRQRAHDFFLEIGILAIGDAVVPDAYGVVGSSGLRFFAVRGAQPWAKTVWKGRQKLINLAISWPGMQR